MLSSERGKKPSGNFATFSYFQQINSKIMHGKVISENRCSDVHLKFLGAALLKSTFTVLNFCQLLFESIKHAQLLQKYSILVEYGNWLLAYTQCMWISTCAKLIIITDFQWELYRFGKDNSTNNFTFIKQVFHFPNWKDVESFTSIYQLLGHIHMENPQV